MNRPEQTDAWQKLHDARQQARQISLSERFDADPERAARFSLRAGPLHGDFSRHHLDDATLETLLSLAEQCALPARLSAMASGETVNCTEQRRACHNRLRAPWAGQEDPEIAAMRAAMAQTVEAVHSGRWVGATGKPFDTVVNIGIGGSDFGPQLACQVLSGCARAILQVEFVSNIDPGMLAATLDRIDPTTTLFLISSKSFGTEETLHNARTAKAWLEGELGVAQADHFLAITADTRRAENFGIRRERIISFPDWVGGRFSLWSAIGLPVALGYGMPTYERLLAGGASIDRHVAEQSLSDNLPVILGLLDVWYRNFWNSHSLAILPYCHQLRQLPSYLQQLFMESNGKSVDQSGEPLDIATSPVIWGNEGTNAQHSFMQMLHQGSEMIASDFILPLRSQRPSGDQHQRLVANCLSQVLVLMRGKEEATLYHQLLSDGVDEGRARLLARHRRMPGNRPSTLISFPYSNAETLGALIALYEYRALTAAAIWDINPFDQWGVELGKPLSGVLLERLEEGGTDDMDSATRAAVERYRAGGY